MTSRSTDRPPADLVLTALVQRKRRPGTDSRGADGVGRFPTQE